MKYFKPEMEIIEFAAEDILATSSIGPTPPPTKGPVIEKNDSIIEALDNVFDFIK